MTLHETLAALGYTTAPAGHSRKHVIDAEGVTVYTGRAHEVWAWLRDTEQVAKMRMRTHAELVSEGMQAMYARRREAGEPARRPETRARIAESVRRYHAARRKAARNDGKAPQERDQ